MHLLPDSMAYIIHHIMNRLSHIKSTFLPPQILLIRQIFAKGLFSINAINKTVNKQILSMAYSPGVGAACMKIVEDISCVNNLTLRGRAIAIVSDGSLLSIKGEKFAPVMDWFVAQIKFYSGLDAFPFLIKQSANIESVLDDLSTCYGTILYLDDKIDETTIIPKNIALLKQNDIIDVVRCQRTCAEETSKVLSYIVRNRITGRAEKNIILKSLEENHFLFKQNNSYNIEINDGRDLKTRSLQMHEHFNGKIQIQLSFFDILPFKKIFTDQTFIQNLSQHPIPSRTKKLSAIVTDGTAILGFGNIGPEAGLPVMEGKSLLFKLLGDVDVVPLCIKKRKTPEQSVSAILDLLSFYEAINLEDFAAPECFAIEQKLSAKRIMPIFHDDQHGTAIVTLAALINGVKLTKKHITNLKVVINGAGAAGLTIAKLLYLYGVKNLIVCDTKGTIFAGRTQNMNKMKNQIASFTNKQNIKGTLQNALKGSDVFVGVSVKDVLKKEWLSSMNKNPIIFAMANPDPEITFSDAVEGGAFIYGSGRSDYQNQINNSLAFPGIFRAIHEHNLKEITEEMKVKAAEVIAECVRGKVRPDYIIPDSLDKDVPIRISKELGSMQ